MNDDPDPNEILYTGRIDLQDFMYTIMYSVKPYHVDFIIHQAESEDADGNRNFIPITENWTAYDKEPNTESEILRGYVKWDGCTNWETAKGRMVHCCYREEIASFGDILGQCYDLGKLCPNWNEE